MEIYENIMNRGTNCGHLFVLKIFHVHNITSSNSKICDSLIIKNHLVMFMQQNKIKDVDK